MQKLIKSIRDYMGLSQADFAEKLGVNFATVNRWENGRAIPTKLAQAKLYDYCKEQGIDTLMLTSNPKRIAANALYQSLGFERKETNVYRMKMGTDTL
jgi:transcriptional regulator with XRE-family HTH domain